MSPCPCDAPPALGHGEIVAGLPWIPRQVATFPNVRRAMLSSLRRHAPLDGWRGREGNDLGIMLIEMWAYVADVLSFYDEVIGQEAYLGTARLRPSLRRLVGLIGYLPRPAVAARVDVALLVDGRQPVTVEQGLVLRSGAFGSEPPQVFETDSATTAHPFTNHWRLEPPVPSTVGQLLAAGGSLSTVLLDTSSGAPRTGPVLVEVGGRPGLTQARTVVAVTDAGLRRRVDATFDAPLVLPDDVALADVALARPAQTAGLWKMAPAGSGSTVNAVVDLSGPRTSLVLDGLYRTLRAGDPVLVLRNGEHRWFVVEETSEAMLAISAPTTVSVGSNSVTVPAASVPATRLRLDAGLNAPDRRLPGAADWTTSQAVEAAVSHGFVVAGRLTARVATEVAATDLLTLAAPVEIPRDGSRPSRLLLEDCDQVGQGVAAAVDLQARRVTVDQGARWAPALRLPVEVFGNVVSATRGETVRDEVLGSGDGRLASQSFRLRKKPLTYLSAPATSGVRSTLDVRVSGVRWKEVPSFFGVGPDAQVYVVRQDDDGESAVIFGDGVRGARLPSGADNVVASYRHGAGAASPPARSVTQLGRPVKGVASVVNPVPAAGGADAEGPDGIRRFAPGFALVLGRVVSGADMEAVVSGLPGVRAVEVAGRWHPTRQCPTVQVRYVGEAGVQVHVSQALRAMADPSAAIDVERAEGVPARISIDIAVDPRRAERDVRGAVRRALTNANSGLLAPEHIGIGTPLYRSRIFEAVLAVEGAQAVRGIGWDGVPFTKFARSPGSGRYFDIEAGGLVLNGQAGDE